MRRRFHPVMAVPLVALVLLAGGCSGKGKNPLRPTGQLASDFHLADVNPNSATFGASVSPRDHLGQISAWYFGHAT